MSVEKDAAILFDRFWNWRLRNAPEFATSVGVHDYDDRLDEMSLSSYLRRVDEAKLFLDDVRKLAIQSKTENSSNETLLNIKLLENDLELFINGSKFYSYLWPLNRLEGPQSDYPRLISWMKTNSEEDFVKIIARLRAFPQQIQELIVLLKEGVRLGITMHKVSIESVPTNLKDIANDTVENLQVFECFQVKPERINLERWEMLKKEAKKVISEYMQPSYQLLHDFLVNSYLPFTRENISASSLPNGQEFYKACLKFHTTTNLSPTEVHELGKAEVKRITERMKEIQNKVQYNGTLTSFREFLRTDPQFKFKSKKDVITQYQEIAANITKLLPKYFEILPKAKFEIIPYPESIAATMPGAYYLAAPEDGSRPGTFWINTFNVQDQLNYEAVALCLHEAEPGHHLQFSLAQESGSSVNFRRFLEDRKNYEPPFRFGLNTAYVEGWGLYSEYLGEEMELYSNPYQFFGRLSLEMLRACRLVVDTGMHALGWSREQAIAYMMENTAAEKRSIESEIDRYITWPGQACGYKIGEIKIKELRKKAEEKLGSKFDVKKFHTLIASMGAVPLDFLELQIDSFIAKFS